MLRWEIKKHNTKIHSKKKSILIKVIRKNPIKKRVIKMNKNTPKESRERERESTHSFV